MGSRILRCAVRAVFGALALTSACVCGPALAQGIPPPPTNPDGSVSTLRAWTVLGDSVTPFTVPNAFSAEDFSLRWVGDPIPGATAAIEHGSLEWVRIDKGHGFLDVPRARISVSIPGARGGRITNSGFTQPLATGEAGVASGHLTVPMLSGPRNPITVTVLAGGEEITGHLELRFTPGPAVKAKGRIYRDVTCSAFGLTVDSTNMRDDEWAFIGCNLVTVASTDHPTTFLEILVLWDGAGETITVGGVPVEPVSDSLWAIQAPPKPGTVELASGEHTVVLHYRIPKVPHDLSVGAGIGPYFDSFTRPAPARSFTTVEPLLTLYLSYLLREGSRIAIFDATEVRNNGYSDVGFYLQQRSAEFLDRRAAFTLFVGGHILAFRLDKRDHYTIRTGAPQGGEFLLRDVFAWGKNLTVGGLINPGISGKYYFNAYARWGSSRLFVELNYVGWREHEEKPPNAPIDLRSLGISIGGPLFKAL